VTDVDELREQLAVASGRAYTRGIQTGNGGNVSARLPDGRSMLVTASGGSFGDCRPESFLTTDLDGTVREGKGKPTRETYMHGHIYQCRPDVSAVVHVHAPYAIAMAHAVSQLPLVTWHSRLKIPGSIPVLDVQSPMVRPSDWPIVERCLLAEPHVDAFILRDHGIVAMAQSPDNAEHLAELVEETAQIAFLTHMAGRG